MKRSARSGKLTVTPAPNAYHVASTIGNQAVDLPSAPMYTMSGRQKKATGFVSPGPARYPAVKLEQFKRQMPRPVILGRPVDRSHRTQRTPAPNAYLPGPGFRYANAPHFTMAGRLPTRSDPYYTPADKVPDWE